MKYYGKVGFLDTEESETASSVYEEHYIEKYYYGDHISNFSGRWKTSNKMLDDVTITTKISIIADPFAHQNFYNIRYLEWRGALWKVTNVEVQSPRLILTVGEIYNK